MKNIQDVIDSLDHNESYQLENGMIITKLSEEFAQKYFGNTVGAFRKYKRIGKFGIKYVNFEINLKASDNLFRIISALIMNYKERRRYISNTGSPLLCRVYFSCGIFNIVEHLNVCTNIFVQSKSIKDTFLFEPEVTKPCNLGFDKYNNLKILDYGDFDRSKLSKALRDLKLNKG